MANVFVTLQYIHYGTCDIHYDTIDIREDVAAAVAQCPKNKPDGTSAEIPFRSIVLLQAKTPVHNEQAMSGILVAKSSIDSHCWCTGVDWTGKSFYQNHATCSILLAK